MLSILRMKFGRYIRSNYIGTVKSMLSKSVLSRVLGYTQSYEVCERIHEYFNLDMKDRAR